MTTSFKGVSSMKIHRDLGVTQKTALYMLYRIRESWNQDEGFPFAGPMEVDETYFGLKWKNMSNAKWAKLEGRDPVGKIGCCGDEGPRNEAGTRRCRRKC